MGNYPDGVSDSDFYGYEPRSGMAGKLFPLTWEDGAYQENGDCGYEGMEDEEWQRCSRTSSHSGSEGCSPSSEWR